MSVLNELVTLAESASRRTMFSLTSPQLTRLIGEPFFWFLGLRRRGKDFDLPEIKRVLLVRLDGIGDVVMTSSFLRELRRNLPDARITLIVEPAVYNLVELCPYVNEVLTFDWKVSRYLDPIQRHWQALRLAYRDLWHRRFDLAVVPRWDADYYYASFLAYFSGAPWRVGYSENVIDLKRRLNGSFDKLFTHVLDNNVLKHEVEHNLDVIHFLDGTVQEDRMELWVSPEDEAFAEQVLKSHEVPPDDLLIAFGPGAGDLRRMWPISNFIELGAWLKMGSHARIMVLGGQGEEPLGRELQRQLGDPVVNVVGQATLRQTGALLKRCCLYVGNDAGPMHMAAAAGAPVIEISCHPCDNAPWHSNSPIRFGPWGVPHIVLQPRAADYFCSEGCKASNAHCILGITVEQAKEAVVSCMSQLSGVVPHVRFGQWYTL